MLWKPQTKAKGGRGKIHNFMLARDFLGLQKTPLVILQFEKKKKKKKKDRSPAFAFYMLHCKL